MILVSSNSIISVILKWKQGSQTCVLFPCSPKGWLSLMSPSEKIPTKHLRSFPAFVQPSLSSAPCLRYLHSSTVLDSHFPSSSSWPRRAGWDQQAPEARLCKDKDIPSRQSKVTPGPAVATRTAECISHADVTLSISC